MLLSWLVLYDISIDIMLIIDVLLVFVFKQKTAYER